MKPIDTREEVRKLIEKFKEIDRYEKKNPGKPLPGFNLKLT